jgi:predicted metalloprotease with PDZ domain
MSSAVGRIARAIFLLFCAAAIFSPGSRAANDPLHYELKFEKPNTHLMDVTIHASGLDGKSVEFAMPDWAPGSYYIENYWMYVQGFHAESADGKALAWHKTDEQTWHIELSRATSVKISYQIYGDTLANNKAQYNDRHAFFGGPAVWMYMVNGKERPIELAIDVPSGWKVATGMPRRDATHFSATNYDWFADAPMEISDFKEQDFEFAGTKYHVINHDALDDADFAKFVGDVQKLVETLVPIMASAAGTPAQQAPFKDYWFLFHIWPNAGGGLEHLNSTQINFRSDWDSRQPNINLGNDYNAKLSVTAHEFFHAWNVKRIRPRPLGPFDYSRQVHTPSLWISEGLTSYYGSIAMVRSGLITPQEYLDSISKLITKFEGEPGRKERSIEDTSWDTWFVRNKDLDTNLMNTNYSYYDGGQVVGQLLDLAIRNNTKNAKSLDDWMRLMYSRYALPKPGFEPDDAIKAMSEVAGMDMSDFFHGYISGKEAIPYETYFAYAGIAVEKNTDASKPWAGFASMTNDDGRAKLTNVFPRSPAEAAGISKDDVVLAIDGRTVTGGEINEALGAHKPGDAVKLTVVRLGQLREFTLTLGADPTVTYKLKLVEHPTEMQRQIFNSWMGVK